MSNPSTNKGGFKPAKMLGAGVNTGALNEYRIASGYAANIGEGDPVKQINTGYINIAGATDVIRGIFARVEYLGSDGVPVITNHWTSGTTTLGSQDVRVLVYDDPNQVFEVRALNSSSVIAQASMGNTMNSYNLGSVDATGRAGAGVDASVANGTSTVWKLLGYSTRADNDIASANPLLLVVPALHELKQTAGI